MSRLIHCVCASSIVLAAACSINVPFDSHDGFVPLAELLEEAQESFEGAVADPLSAKPFPVLIGGDSQRIFYATSLSDVLFNFPGSSNDVVLPSFVGPSNVYKFEERERELIRPLIPAGSFYGLSTDGRFVAYVTLADGTSGPQVLHVTDLGTDEDQILFNEADEPDAVLLAFWVEIDSGRIAYRFYDQGADVRRLRVEDLTGQEPTLEIETEVSFSAVDLHGNQLAYFEGPFEGPVRLTHHDLSTEQTQTLVEGIRTSPSYVGLSLVQSNNAVVWREPISDNLSRVMRYDLESGLSRVWADSVAGDLVGATDEYFVTEERIFGDAQSGDRLVITRYDAKGTSRKMAEFRADGLSGQTKVVGNRAAWVNPERKIVLAPLDGGDRTIFRPY